MIEKIPDWYRIRRKDNPGTGAHVLCTKCGTTVTSNICKHREYHVYQTRPWNPFLQRITNVRSWAGVKTFKEFRRLHEAYKKELEDNKFNMTLEPKPEYKPTGLRECAQMYIDFLKGFDASKKDGMVPDHERQVKSKNYVATFKRYYTRFVQSLKDNGIKTPTLTIYDIDSECVGYFSKSIKSNPAISKNSSYNDHINKLQTFFNHLINYREYDLRNPFNKVQSMSTVGKAVYIERHEFEVLLSLIKKENGLSLHKIGGNGKPQNLYRDWTKTAFRLAILTGVRLSNLFELKWSDVHENVIEIENLKVNHGKKEELEEHKDFYYAIRTSQLNELLEELGENEHAGSDRYILEPDYRYKRSTLAFFATQGFTHFWAMTGFEKKATFHSLRSTAITNFKIVMSDNIDKLKTHKSDKIRAEHYENDTAILSAYVGRDFYQE